MLRIPFVTILLCVSVAQSIAGECNPLIDGTYCATQPNSLAITVSCSAQMRHAFLSRSGNS